MEELILGNTKVKFIFPNQTQKENKKNLEKIYDVCNELFKSKKECFYTREEVKKLKANSNNLFL